jgi:hypothetical protein
MKKSVLIVSMLVLCFIISDAKDKHFKRVETFPSGDQTKSLIGSFLSGIKDYNIVKHTFDAPYEIVWPIIKKISQKFAKVGGRSVISIDENNGRVQNGMITQNAMIGMGSGAWLDEFLMEAKALDTKTDVAIARKVIKREYTGRREWKTNCSNSKIENWLLTQIEDEIKNYSVSQNTPVSGQGTTTEITSDLAKAVAGKYVRKFQPSNYCELKPDGTFYDYDSGKISTGTYKISGEILTLTVSDGRVYEFKFKEDTISYGTIVYVKTEESQLSSSTPSEIMGNLDILLMVEAKFTDVVIISKIKNSKCKFDTSTNEIVKLKKAGVSDEVIKVMIEMSSK